MKKYFIVSDVHGYYTILRNTLDEKGFELSNPNHILIIAGDVFDRGREPKELFEFLTSIPKERFVYIRGNHEDLLIKCLDEINKFGFPSSYHFSNGTVQTILDICGLTSLDIYDLGLPENKVMEKMQPYVDFINSSIDYYEIEDYIITHGWVPNKFQADWEEESPQSWYDARWYNGMDMWQNGYKVPDKTIVCGHWHTSWGFENIHKNNKEYEPFIDEGIIAIDASTVRSKKINCIIIEGENNGELLKHRLSIS